MRIKLLLDEHLAVEVAEALRRRFPKLDVKSIHETELAGLPDPALLEIMDAEQRTLVTRDVNTVPGFVAARLAAGQTHGGVIYADSKRLRQTDVKGIIRRLSEVLEKRGNEEWNSRSGWL